MPPDARRTLAVYNLLFPLVFLAMLPGVCLRMLRRGGFRAHFGQRFGRYPMGEPGRVWIHSISVGETLIALKLARAWRAAHPTDRLLLSTTTTTGFALAQENAGPWLEPIYNPIDFLPIVRRALRRLRPGRIILIEGEAWPNLVAESRRRGIPIALADARLSPRSEERFRKGKYWTGPIFRLLDVVLVPEPDDLRRWKSLGLRSASLQCTGSMKFDQPAAAPGPRLEELRALLPPGPVLVAGSTHEGEELLLARLLPALRVQTPDLRLVITPRHVERVPAILRELESTGLRTARRTAAPAPDAWDLLLVDTTGELRDWYALATVVFVGKSLTATGGQNPVEPALLGKPVVFGPHMENFRGAVGHLLAARGAVQVKNAAALQTEITRLLGDERARTQLAENARAALASHQGATERVVTQLGVTRRALDRPILPMIPCLFMEKPTA